MTTEQSGPRAAPPGFSDHTFKSSSGTELSVRVWPANPPVTSPAPFVSLTHGGGLIGGHHFTPPPWVFPGFRARGYHLVSHSYRLAPQARLDEQLADSLESLAWCRTNLPSILGADKVDVDRYALYGDSAGGLLVTLMGLHLTKPPPRAIVNVYGVVDFPAMVALEQQQQTGDLAPPQPWTGEFTEAELQAALGDRDPANILTVSTSWREMEECSEVELSRRWATDFQYTKRARLQAELHVWRSMHPQGVSLLGTAAIHPEKFADETALQAFMHSVSPLPVLRQRLAEGRTEYPPTAILHGTGDSAVPVQQSYDMAETLRAMGVPLIERYEEGEEHVFDVKYTVRTTDLLFFCSRNVS
jgi:acetyl esterase/lipase